MIGIIDYGMGNLGSVENACRFLEQDAAVIDRPEQAEKCRSLILPGVGAFGDCMRSLEQTGFAAQLKAWAAAGRPLLGICLGQQVLFESSEESPGVAGLGLLKGTVRKFVPAPEYKIPQIGWNQVRQARTDCPLFAGVPDDSFLYFVHSFYVDPAEKRHAAGITEFGIEYASVVWQDNIMATQFHPEKSHHVGLYMLKNFCGIGC
jgi:glutamine amidotransferase